MVSDSVFDVALSYFGSNYNCAQAVVKSFLRHKGFYFDGAIQIAAGLGAGISFSSQQCGVISGAILATGRMVGTTVSDLREHRAKTHDLASELQANFAEEFKTIICDDLTGVNMRDEDALDKAFDEGLFKEVCPKFAKKTVRILMDMFPD
jgi:C_GCAxxG_C_C family probable redox protein